MLIFNALLFCFAAGVTSTSTTIIVAAAAVVIFLLLSLLFGATALVCCLMLKSHQARKIYVMHACNKPGMNLSERPKIIDPQEEKNRTLQNQDPSNSSKQRHSVTAYEYIFDVRKYLIIMCLEKDCNMTCIIPRKRIVMGALLHRNGLLLFLGKGIEIVLFLCRGLCIIPWKGIVIIIGALFLGRELTICMCVIPRKGIVISAFFLETKLCTRFFQWWHLTLCQLTQSPVQSDSPKWMPS